MGSREGSGRASVVEAEGTSARALLQQEKIKRASSTSWTYPLAEILYLPTAASLATRAALPAMLTAALIVGRIVKGLVYPSDVVPRFHGNGPDADKAELLQEVLWRTNPFKKVRPSRSEGARKLECVPERPSLAAALVVQQVHPPYAENEGWVDQLAEWYADTAARAPDTRCRDLGGTMFVIGKMRCGEITKWLTDDPDKLLTGMTSVQNFIVGCQAKIRGGTEEMTSLGEATAYRNASVAAPLYEMLHLVHHADDKDRPEYGDWFRKLSEAADYEAALQVTCEIPGVSAFSAKNILMYLGVCETRFSRKSGLEPLPWVADWETGTHTMCGPGPTKTIDKSRDQANTVAERMAVLQKWCDQVRELLPAAVQIEGQAGATAIKQPSPKELQHIVCKLHVAMGFVFSGKPGKNYRKAPARAAPKPDNDDDDDDDESAEPQGKRRAIGGG